MAREADPQTQIDELASALATTLPRAVLVRGPEPWFRERAVALVIGRARERGFEIALHDGGDRELDLAGLLADLTSASMFAAARCVVVRNPEGLLKKASARQAQGDEPPLTRAVLSFLGRANEAGTLVLAAESLRADSVIAKAIAKTGGPTITCRKLWDSPPPWERDPDPRRTELVQWILSRARARTLALDPGGAALLAAASGNDLYALETQLERLSTGGGGGLAAIESDAAGSPWRTADEIARGDVAAGLFDLETLFQNGMRDDEGGARKLDREALVAMLVPALRRNVRQALAGALALAAGSDEAQAAEAAGVPGGPAAGAWRAALAARSGRDQLAMLNELTELERRSRRGSKLDENDLALFALRWRARKRSTR